MTRFGVLSVLLLAVAGCCVLLAAPSGPSLLLRAEGASVSEWKSRSIYQLLTDRFARSDSSVAPCENLSGYCGGTFQGVVDHLDYIVSLGFDALWISPVVANVAGSYHGYGATDIYTINPFFGGEAGLKNLVDTAHAKGMYVVVDVVGNHMGIPDNGDFSSYNPFDSLSYYHPCGGCPSNCWISDFQNRTETMLCQLDGLPDLDQSQPFVSEALNNWVAGLVANFSIDGLRIDTVPEVSAEFWSTFQSAAGVYAVGEVFDGSVDFVSSYQAPAGPIDATLSYPMFFTLNSVFAPGGNPASMETLADLIGQYEESFPDTAALGTFLENHDHARFLYSCPSFSSSSNASSSALATVDDTDACLQLYKSGLLFAMYSTGIPIWYYGSEQLFDGGNDPLNRAPLWTTGFDQTGQMFLWTQTIMRYRSSAQVWSNKQILQIVDAEVMAFSRGSVFVALTNSGAAETTRQVTASSSPFAPSDVICNLFWPTEDCVTVAADGSWTLNMLQGEQKVYDLKSNIQAFHDAQQRKKQ